MRGGGGGGHGKGWGSGVEVGIIGEGGGDPLASYSFSFCVLSTQEDGLKIRCYSRVLLVLLGTVHVPRPLGP